MKKRFDIKILGQEISVLSDSGDEHVNNVVSYVNAKLEEMAETTGKVDTLKIAILAALNIADEYFKLKGSKEDIYSQLEKRSERLLSLMDEG